MHRFLVLIAIVASVFVGGCGQATEENTTTKPTDSTDAGRKTNSGPAGATLD